MNEVNSPVLKSLSEDGLRNEIIDALSEIKMLTGVILYDGEMLNAQISVITRFVMSNARFARLTASELRHAFYLNSQGEYSEVYRHYNKELNCEFVGDVLGAYLRYKSAMYDKVRGVLAKALQPPKEPVRIDLTMEHWKQLIEQDYQSYLKGDVEMIFNTSPKYVALRKVGKITFTSKDKWKEWYGRALVKRERDLAMSAPETDGGKASKRHTMDMYRAIRQTGVIPKDESVSVLFAMRKMVYMEFFNVMKSRGRETIF